MIEVRVLCDVCGLRLVPFVNFGPDDPGLATTWEPLQIEYKTGFMQKKSLAICGHCRYELAKSRMEDERGE